MYNHAPQDYQCPICLGVKRSHSDATLIRGSDVVYEDELVTVFINSFFMETNPGHVIVVPNQHVENIYELDGELGRRIFDLAKRIALAMKQAYGCDGITTRQNNEPAGDQHAFHYHFHVFPRYNKDRFNEQLPSTKRLASPTERAGYAQKLRAALEQV